MPLPNRGGTSKGFGALPLPLAKFIHELTTRQVAIQARPHDPKMMVAASFAGDFSNVWFGFHIT
jgi:hypothetical protein